MRAVAPRIAGVAEVTLAEDQHELMTVTAGIVDYQNGARGWVTRWRLSELERYAVSKGDDIYVEILGVGMPPLAVTVSAPAHLVVNGARDAEEGR